MLGHQDAKRQAKAVGNQQGDDAHDEGVLHQGQTGTVELVHRVVVRELAALHVTDHTGVVGQRMEIDGGIHILVGAQHTGVLLLEGRNIAGGVAHNCGDLRAPVGGIGGTQVHVDEVLMDKREPPIHIQ